MPGKAGFDRAGCPEKAWNHAGFADRIGSFIVAAPDRFVRRISAERRRG
jgi:hypothetical protein